MDPQPTKHPTPHPQMFEEDDYGLHQVREIALAFPEAGERVTFGRPMFRAGKLFAVYGAMTKGPDKQDFPHSVLVHPDADSHEALMQDPRFFVPGYFGPAGWVGLNLDAAPVDWQEVAELLDESYRNAAPKRLIAQLEAEGGPATRR